jgi:hypothetical protein
MGKHIGRSVMWIYLDQLAWLDRHWPQQVWYGYPAEDGCFAEAASAAYQRAKLEVLTLLSLPQEYDLREVKI